MMILVLIIFVVPSYAISKDMESEKPETWTQPPSKEQADRDPTLVPVGKGAIFVPSMTDPSREPRYLIIKDDKVIEDLPHGRRAILDPGIYEVKIGSGTLSDKFSRRVLVKEGRTTIVPATWSSLVVNVVDDRRDPFRGSYELIRLPDRKNLGVGLGADVERGEEVRTWVLEPSTYMIIKTGESLQARRDFCTIRLMPGELHKFTLVMDREDGSLLGCGEVQVVDGETKMKDWRLHLIVGVDAEMNRRSDKIGFPSGIGFSLGGYLDFSGLYKPERHLFYSRLRLEEKHIKVPDQPFQKDQDELKIDTLYVYRLLSWFGPYLRSGMITAVFPGYAFLGNSTKVKRVDQQGQIVEDMGVYDGRFKLSKPFSPVEVKFGTGVSFIIVASYILDGNIRMGFGGRALFTRGLLDPVGRGKEGEFLVKVRGNAYQYGPEATAVGSLRFTRWVIATTELDFLDPIDDLFHPIVTWDNNVALRLVSFASLNYVFRLVYDRGRSEKLQTEHRVLLRFTWQIL